MKKAATIDAYENQLSPESRAVLQQLRALVKKVVPESIEKVSYGMPLFDFKGTLFWFADWKAHYGIYPEPSAIVHFEKVLKKYVTSKGCIQVPKGGDLPLKFLKNLLLYRVKENIKKENEKNMKKTKSKKSRKQAVGTTSKT